MEFADLSIEIGHLYLDQLNEETAMASMRSSGRWVRPVLDRATKAGREVSIVALLDDYFVSGTRTNVSVPDAAEMLTTAARRAEIPLHHIVLESTCARTVECMLDWIVEQPRRGAGSRGGEASLPPRQHGWLSNGDAMRTTIVRSAADDPFSDSDARDFLEQARFRHAIFLDVELWCESTGSREYACALLAAWWQLLRLGAYGPPTTSLSYSLTPPTCEQAPPLSALATVSVLATDFVEVEHAVRSILSQVFLPEDVRRRWQRTSSFPDLQDHLRRVAYVFEPNGFPISF